MRKLLLLSVLMMGGWIGANAQSISTSPVSGSPFCGGTSVNVPFTIGGAPFSNTPSNNVFTAQLSDASGSFASPTSLGIRTNTTAGTIAGFIPYNTPSGTNYRIRVIGSNPATIGTDNASNLTIKGLAVSAPVFAATSFCQGTPFSMTYTVTCTFNNGGTNNVFTAQLSNASGSFASPTVIGATTSNTSGTINATIPAGTAAGTGYRIRIVTNNPVTVNPDNGTDLTVVAPVGTPATYGNGLWNVYAYATSNFGLYSGFYTENNLSFDTQTRWAVATSPSNADASTGAAYQGCPITFNSAYSFVYKRQNFTCGYYQINIPSHDDVVTLFINGTQVNTAACCTSNLTNFWTGFLGPTSTVDVQLQNNATNSNLAVQIVAAPNPLTLSPPATVCASTPTNLTVSSSSTAALTYAWTSSPAGFTATGASVIANPAVTTTYTVVGTDNSGATTCTVSNSVVITVGTPTTTITATQTTICAGVTTATLTATGANSYLWSSSPAGFSSTSNVITVNPSVTTTYTVAGFNNCTTVNASKTITVQNIPSSPSPTTFGSGTWNVYGYNGNVIGTNYTGYYTENGSGATGLDFNTTSRWGNTTAPSSANATNGLAYNGCTLPTTFYAAAFKRTNFTCGYYNIDIPYHDDNVTLLVNGTQVFQNNNYNPTGDFAVWKGFLNASSTVEFQLLNQSGPGSLQVAFTITSPLTLSPPAVICAGTNTAITSTSAIAGATYQWTVTPSSTPGITFSNPNVGNTFANTVATTPATNYILKSTITDAAGTLCTASSTVQITVDPLPNTAVTPTTVTTSCPSLGIVLTASGANTYTWNNSGTLSAASGYQVTAMPTVTTTYTVTGSNNCTTKDAMTTINVTPLPAYTSYPTNVWNAYGFNSQTIGTSYVGYYTENGSGASTFDFNTQTRWANGAAPSTANTSSGNAWLGCAMSATNMSMSFKRQGFPCGIYSLNILYHDDGFVFFVNGVQQAVHAACCDTHTAVWTGPLNSASQVELQLMQGTGGSGLQVQFVPVSLPTATQSLWIGPTSTDWFTASNWCNAVPSSTIDAVIPGGTPFSPAIGNTGAQVKSLTINPAQAATAFATAVPAASLSSGAFNLSVFANWTNNGIFSAGAGSVTFTGAGVLSNTITSANTEVFNNVIINNSKNVTIASGIQQIAGNLTMTLGKVFQNGGLEVLNGGTTSGASNASYVDGFIKKTGNSAFVFPVGTGGFYRPIAISAPALATDAYSAQYFNVSPSPSPYPNASRDATLDHVSAAEYWMLNQNAGSSSVNVTLSWNTNSGGVGLLPDLRVAGWNIGAAKWKDLGNSGTTGNLTTGTVTSGAPVSTFGPFTLASISLRNPLPVELVSFACNLAESKVTLSWVTASELNSDYFAVERSRDGLKYTSIGAIKSAGTTSEVHQYELRDISPPTGKLFYRLRQVDIDQKSVYSEPCSVENLNEAQPVPYPNPSSTKVSFDFDPSLAFSLGIINGLGQKITAPLTINETGIEVNTAGLTPGVYIFELIVSGKLGRFRVVVQH